MVHVLGLQPEYDGLTIDPCIPEEWNGFDMTRNFRGKTLRINVENPDGVQKGVKELVLNGEKIDGNFISEKMMLTDNDVMVVMG